MTIDTDKVMTSLIAATDLPASHADLIAVMVATHRLIQRLTVLGRAGEHADLASLVAQMDGLYRHLLESPSRVVAQVVADMLDGLEPWATQGVE